MSHQIAFSDGLGEPPQLRRRQDESLPKEAGVLAKSAQEGAWYPVSRHPEKAFQMYTTPPNGFVRAADQVLLRDIANLNLQPGLPESQFHEQIRTLLCAIPMAQPLFKGTQDFFFTRQGADRFIESMATDDYSATDIWTAFVRWMAFFFRDRFMVQPVTELAIRRAQDLGQQASPSFSIPTVS